MTQKKENERMISRYSRDPKHLRNGAVMSFLFGIGMLLMGIIGYSDERAMVKKCTAETTGTVTSVQAFYGAKNTNSYVATVVPGDTSIFGADTLESTRTSHKYYIDEGVKIWYDPSDTSNYYIQYEKPDATGYSLMTGAALFAGVGAVMLMMYMRKIS